MASGWQLLAALISTSVTSDGKWGEAQRAFSDRVLHLIGFQCTIGSGFRDGRHVNYAALIDFVYLLLVILYCLLKVF